MRRGAHGRPFFTSAVPVGYALASMDVSVEAFVNGCVAVFGLIWGSYLNVVVYRLPKGLSTAVPPSHCPRCSSRIGPLENVPVLSWILLGARCRHCRGSISARYPIVETAVAGIFLLGFYRFPEPAGILVGWILGCILLALALIDFDRREVPVVLTLPVGVLGWALQPILGWTPPLEAVWTSLLAVALLIAVSKVWSWMAEGRRPAISDAALGLGDAYCVFLIGSFFGFEATLRIVILALAGATVVAALSKAWSALRGTLGRSTDPADRLPLALPLVTFLAASALWYLLLDPKGPGLDLADIMGGL